MMVIDRVKKGIYSRKMKEGEEGTP